MPALLSILIYSRSGKFQGLWNSVCGVDGGKYFIDSGGVAQIEERGINGENGTWRTPCFFCPPEDVFLMSLILLVTPYG